MDLLTYWMLNIFRAHRSPILHHLFHFTMGLYLASWTPHDNEEKTRWKFHHKPNQKNTTLGTINHCVSGALEGLGSAHFPFILLRKPNSILLNYGHLWSWPWKGVLCVWNHRNPEVHKKPEWVSLKPSKVNVLIYNYHRNTESSCTNRVYGITIPILQLND